MKNRRVRLGWLLLLQGASVGIACAQSGTAFWALPQSGQWNDASNWIGDVVPGGPGADDLRVVVDLVGDYTIDLDFNATISGLELTGPGARLALTAPGTGLTTTGNNLFNGANIQGGQSSSIQANGNSVLTGGATIAGIGSFSFGGMVEFTGDDIDLCDTCVAINAGGVWSGSGSFNLEGVTGSDLVIEAGGSLALLGAGDRFIRGTSGSNQFINNGDLDVSLADGADTLEFDGTEFLNRSGGTVRMRTGTLRSDLSGSLSGTNLRGGDWFVGENGTVDAMGATLEGIDVSIELSGVNASFAALDSLNQITGRGALRVMNGKQFATDGSSSLTVGGTLEVGAGSGIAVNGGLANLAGGTLSGGSFIVGGELALVQGGPGGIDALAAGLMLKGAGSISDGQGGDLLAGISAITDAGVLELREGASFTTAGDLSLAGRLDLGRGTNIDIRGGLDAFQSGVFGNADLVVRGEVLADNTRVESVAGRLAVGLDGRVLVRDGGGTLDGLVFLREVRAGGELRIVEGRDLDLTATSNTVAIAGSLVLGATAPGEADAVLGSVLSATAIEIGPAGTLTSVIAGLDNFGRIETASVTYGLGAAGETAGTLAIELGEGYTAAFGDRFLIVGSAGVLGGGFSSLTVAGDLGGGLFFEQFVDGTGVGVVVVPAPAGAALIGFSLASASRRRR